MATSHMDSSNSKAREFDDWVMVEKTHTKDREPQYNGDNESPKKLASSSSSSGSSSNVADVPELSHRPDSHGETETDDSIDTVPDSDVTQETATFGRGGLSLTKDTLGLSSRQVGAYAPGISGWLSEAGASFAPFEPLDDSSMDDTMMPSTMLGSTVSIVSSDGAAPIHPSPSDLREIGSWAR